MKYIGFFEHTIYTYLPEVFPLPLQNHFFEALHMTTAEGSWMPQYLWLNGVTDSATHLHVQAYRHIVCTKHLQAYSHYRSRAGIQKYHSSIGSVVLVWLYIIRFSCSKKANEEQSLVLVLVSQLIRKKGY